MDGFIKGIDAIELLAGGSMCSDAAFEAWAAVVGANLVELGALKPRSSILPLPHCGYQVVTALLVETNQVSRDDVLEALIPRARFDAWCQREGWHLVPQAPRSCCPAAVRDCDAALAHTDPLAGDPALDGESITRPSPRLKAKARELAQQIGDEQWNSGVRQVTIRGVAAKVAAELAHLRVEGQRGPISASSARTLLKGWSYKSPKGR